MSDEQKAEVKKVSYAEQMRIQQMYNQKEAATKTVEQRQIEQDHILALKLKKARAQGAKEAKKS